MILQFALWQWIVDAGVVRRQLQADVVDGPALDVHAVPPADVRARGEATARQPSSSQVLRVAAPARRDVRDAASGEAIVLAQEHRAHRHRSDVGRVHRRRSGRRVPDPSRPEQPERVARPARTHGDRRSRRSRSRRRRPIRHLSTSPRSRRPDRATSSATPSTATSYVPRDALQPLRRVLPHGRRASTSARTTRRSARRRGIVTRLGAGSRRSSTRSDGPRDAELPRRHRLHGRRAGGKVTRAGGLVDARPGATRRGCRDPTTGVASRSLTPIDVPSSARPDPPKLVYVIPTFSWANAGVLPTKGRDAQAAACACTSNGRGGRPAAARCSRSSWPRTTRPGRRRSPTTRRASRRSGVSTRCTRAPRPPSRRPVDGFPLRAVTQPNVSVPEAPGVDARGRRPRRRLRRGPRPLVLRLQIDTGATYSRSCGSRSRADQPESSARSSCRRSCSPTTCSSRPIAPRPSRPA